MAKKKNVATKEVKGMVIYLKDGYVAKVEDGCKIALGEFRDAIVAEVKENEIDSLKLYIGEEHFCGFDVNSALMNAFEYDCKRDSSNFLGEIDKLRELFLKKAGRTCLARDEKMEMKKFIYASYVQAKKLVK